MSLFKVVKRIVVLIWLVSCLSFTGVQALLGQAQDSTLYHHIDSLVFNANQLEYSNPDLAHKKSVEAFRMSISHGYLKGRRDALNLLGKVYMRTAQYDSAAYCLQQAIRLDSLNDRQEGMVVSLGNMAQLKTRLGEFEKAIEYYYRALKFAEDLKLDRYTAILYNNIAGRYRDLERPDKAMEYTLKALEIWQKMADQEALLGYGYFNLSILCFDFPELIPEDDPKAAFTYLDQAEYYFQIVKDTFKLNDCKLNRSNLLVAEENGAPEAYRLALEATAYFEATGNLLEYADGLLMIGQSLVALGKPQKALEKIRLARQIGQKNVIYDIEQRALFRESEALMAMGKYQQSSALLTEAYAFRDSILGHGLKAELSEIQEKFNLSQEKANRLEMEGIARKEKERATRLSNTVIIVSLVAALLFTFLLLVLRLRRNREKMRIAEFQRNLADEKTQVAALKLQMLGAQMNPHFVKNALSSIQSLLQDKQVDHSNSYLEAFARLQKTLLETTSEHTIALEDELQLIRDYVKIEQLRFKQSFDFTLVGVENLDLEYDRIPSMMLQPIIENAINHGLFHKDGQGHLKISFQRMDTKEVELLQCNIEDDGVGLTYTKGLTLPGRKSRSMDILKKRLAILSHRLDYSFDLRLESLSDLHGQGKGTRAIILLPLV